MKNAIQFLFACVLFSACGNEVEKKAPLSMEEFAGQIGAQQDTANTIVVETTKVPQGIFDQLIFNQLNEFDTVTFQSFHPLDRFTFNQRKKITLKSKVAVQQTDENEINPTASLYYYTFSDTLKTKNAFYNWLDCFGPDCAMVKPNETTMDIKTPPLFAVVYDTVIFIADYRCEDKKQNWKPLQDSVIHYFGKEYNYRIDAGCG